jgi:hypothetical protein
MIDKSVLIAKDKTVKPYYVLGISIINHRVRLKLNLSLSEYVFIDYIKKHQDDKDTRITYADIFGNTGLKPSEIPDLWKSLKEKKLVYRHETGIVTTTPLWDDHFMQKDNFHTFWNLNVYGNRNKAFVQFERCIKLVSFDVLVSKYKDYLKWCDETDTFKMMASTWLNPKLKHWEDVLPEKQKRNQKPIEQSTDKKTLDYEF